MTEHKSFKRLVRARMAKTGESYTAARAVLLRAEEPKGTTELRLSTSDEKIRQRTGHGWEEWFAILDDWGAADRSHREIARWLAERLAIHPLAWNVQAITASYELDPRPARGRREGGRLRDHRLEDRAPVPVERLYEAVVSEPARTAWLPDAQLTERTASKPKSARYDWHGGPTRVNVTFLPKGEAKSTVALEHRRLADAGEAARMKAYWRARLTALKDGLER